MTVILGSLAWLLTYLLHSTVFLLGAAALAGLRLVRSHAARDTMWKAALLGGLVTATAQTALRLQPWVGHVALAAQEELVDVAQVRPLKIAPAASESTPAGIAFASAIAQRNFRSLPPAASNPLPPAPAASRIVRPILSGVHIAWPAVLLDLWIVFATGLCLHLLWRRVRMSRRLKARRRLTDGALHDELARLCASARVRVPRLSVSDHLYGPISFHGEICVPARAVTELSAAEQRAVLAHELGHIIRKDPLWLWAASLIESVCFVQPLNRVARRRLRESAEYLCDDWAAERTGGLALARCLARVAEWVRQDPEPLPAVSMAGRCSELVNRVERLLEGTSRARPAQLAVRAGFAVIALALVAWTVPGVSAESITDLPRDLAQFDDLSVVPSVRLSTFQGSSWGEIRDDGRLLVFAPGYSARLAGYGSLGFRQYGRAIELKEGYHITVGGRTIESALELCDRSGPVRIVGRSGAWDVTPVRLAGAPQFADTGVDAQGRAIGRLAREAARAHIAAVQAELDSATDVALDGEVDAAIDTLVQLWVRDPESVRRAARRIARAYDKELRPQFESLGVELGRELAPQLQRMTDRLGRDLTPEFQRLGAELGESIVRSLGDQVSREKGPKH